MRARVGGAVLTPAGDRDTAPGARATSGMRECHGVATVRQEMRVRAGRVRCPKAPRRNDANRRHRSGPLGRPRFGKNGLSRDPFLQQELGRPDPRVGMKSLYKNIVAKDIGHRDQRHALMMGEEGTDDFRSGVA